MPVSRESCRRPHRSDRCRPTLADGLSGNLDPDTITFDIVRRLGTRMTIVDDTLLRAAIAGVLVEERLVVEAAGAAGVAARVGGRGTDARSSNRSQSCRARTSTATCSRPLSHHPPGEAGDGKRCRRHPPPFTRTAAIVVYREQLRRPRHAGAHIENCADATQLR